MKYEIKVSRAAEKGFVWWGGEKYKGEDEKRQPMWSVAFLVEGHIDSIGTIEIGSARTK